MNKSFKITYTENGITKTLNKYAFNKTIAESSFLAYAVGSSIELISCERAEYIVNTITINVPYPIEFYIKIEFTSKGAEIVEAFSNGQSWIEYLYLNNFQEQVFRHHLIEPQLLEIQDQFLLEAQRPIFELKHQNNDILVC